MLTISGIVFGTTVADEKQVSDLWWALDLLLGLVTYVLVFFRRRHPVAIAAVLAVIGAVSGVAAGPATLALVSMATRRRWREIALVGSLSFAGAQFYSTLFDNEEPVWLMIVANAGTIS